MPGGIFLNDVEFLEGACPSNRPERIRPVTLNLTGPIGTNGTVSLSVQGDVDPVLFHVVDGVTNRVTSETVFPLAVTNTNLTQNTDWRYLKDGLIAVTNEIHSSGQPLIQLNIDFGGN